MPKPDFTANDPTHFDLRRPAKPGVIRRHMVIERCGLRFGIFGAQGKEAAFYTSGGAEKFADGIEAAREIVKALRETEKAAAVIRLGRGCV
jgi:5'-nucleotidase/UDP-sugar diphosphatase